MSEGDGIILLGGFLSKDSHLCIFIFGLCRQVPDARRLVLEAERNLLREE